jgi:hypothetical protein
MTDWSFAFEMTRALLTILFYKVSTLMVPFSSITPETLLYAPVLYSTA